MSAQPRVRRASNTAGTLVKPLAAAFASKPPTPSPPSTARYQNIPSTINTGPNAHNTRPPPPRSLEPFPRVSPSALAALLRAHSTTEETVYALTPYLTSLVLPSPRDSDSDSVAGGQGVGDLPVGTADAPSYLLLDVRAEEEYTTAHIATAISFPAVHIRRDQYPSILYQFVSSQPHLSQFLRLRPLLN